MSLDRFFDVLFSTVALVFLSPLLLPTMILLKFTGEGEIFFMQERIGKNGVPFMLFKFATMLKDSPNIGTGTITIRGDTRVLPVGKVLRKTKVNELPQLLNILLGDMSLIGPRPLTAQAFNAYPIGAQAVVTKVRPGLSGIGSIVFRGEEEIMHGEAASVNFYKDVIAPYKGSLEDWFVANKNMYIYFLTIFATICIVLVPHTGIIWRLFKELPKPPTELREALNYPG